MKYILLEEWHLYIYSRFRLIGPSVHRGSRLYGTNLKEQTYSRKLPGFSLLIWDTMPFNWDRRNRGNPRKYPNYFRNFVQMISTVLMKQACFIVPDGSLCYKHVKLLGSKKWLMRWDVEIQRKSRKVLLILYNCAAIRVFKKPTDRTVCCR